MNDCVKLGAKQLKALENLGIQSLNDMQSAAVKCCRESRNMILLSPTGSGKTLAYLLPLVEKLDMSVRGVQALLVLPSRELASQVADVWRGMNCGYSIVTLYGGRSVAEEAVQLQNVKPLLVAGTPGRLIDHLSKGNFTVDNCRIFVIDEFDKCLELGFCDEMQRLVSMLPNVESRYLLSATEAEEIPDFAGVADVARLDFRSIGGMPPERTSFFKVTTSPDDRLSALFQLLCCFKNEPAIVFCNFRETVEEVRAFLSKKSLCVSAYHGALEQRERESALFRFKSNCANVLVCTDLAARGLDIKDVRHVVHFQRPMTADVFIHRNGRTARWEAEGAVYLISYHNHSLPDFVPQDIKEYKVPKKIALPDAPQWATVYIGKGKRDKISRGDIAGFLMKKGGLESHEVGSIALYERCAYVAVKRNLLRNLLREVSGEKIKGIKTVVEAAKW